MLNENVRKRKNNVSSKRKTSVKSVMKCKNNKQRHSNKKPNRKNKNRNRLRSKSRTSLKRHLKSRQQQYRNSSSLTMKRNKFKSSNILKCKKVADTVLWLKRRENWWLITMMQTFKKAWRTSLALRLKWEELVKRRSQLDKKILLRLHNLVITTTKKYQVLALHSQPAVVADLTITTWNSWRKLFKYYVNQLIRLVNQLTMWLMMLTACQKSTNFGVARLLHALRVWRSNKR